MRREASHNVTLHDAEAPLILTDSTRVRRLDHVSITNARCYQPETDETAYTQPSTFSTFLPSRGRARYPANPFPCASTLRLTTVGRRAPGNFPSSQPAAKFRLTFPQPNQHAGEKRVCLDRVEQKSWSFSSQHHGRAKRSLKSSPAYFEVCCLDSCCVNLIRGFKSYLGLTIPVSCLGRATPQTGYHPVDSGPIVLHRYTDV